MIGLGLASCSSKEEGAASSADTASGPAADRRGTVREVYRGCTASSWREFIRTKDGGHWEARAAHAGHGTLLGFAGLLNGKRADEVPTTLLPAGGLLFTVSGEPGSCAKLHSLQGADPLGKSGERPYGGMFNASPLTNLDMRYYRSCRSVYQNVYRLVADVPVIDGFADRCAEKGELVALKGLLARGSPPTKLFAGAQQQSRFFFWRAAERKTIELGGDQRDLVLLSEDGESASADADGLAAIRAGGPLWLSFVWELYASVDGAAADARPWHNQWKIGPERGDDELARRLLQVLQGRRPDRGTGGLTDGLARPAGHWKRIVSPLALARAGIEVIHHGAVPPVESTGHLVRIYDRESDRWVLTDVEVRARPELAQRLETVGGIAHYGWGSDAVDDERIVGRKLFGAELVDLQRCVDMERSSKQGVRHCRELVFLEAERQLALVGSFALQRCPKQRSGADLFYCSDEHFDEVYRRVAAIAGGWDAASGLLLMKSGARLETEPVNVGCGAGAATGARPPATEPSPAAR